MHTNQEGRTNQGSTVLWKNKKSQNIIPKDHLNNKIFVLDLSGQ